MRLIFLFLLLPALGLCQEFSPSDFEDLSIRSIGPAGMSGRITSIDVDLSDKEHILVGSASGGVWESFNGGLTWEPIFDDQAALSIGAVTIDQSNPDVIWVGTGEGNPRNSLNTGAGIYKSIDGGKTWKLMGLEKTKTIHRIIVHKDQPNIVYVAALGSPWGPNPERGVYKTTDGGQTWKHVLKVNNTTGAADLVVSPDNPNKLVAAMWQHQRTPWDFYSGGEGSGLYLSYDGGDTWKQITHKEGLPEGDLGRIGLAFAPSQPNIVYALVEAKENGLYKSTDGGEKWSLVSTKNIGNRPFYYADIYVDPLNENRIYNLWTYVSRSQDGGKSFETIMDYGNDVHPDHHAFWIDPDDSNYLIDGNDGGLVISRDGGATYQFAGNIPVGQFYHVSIDNDQPYNIYGGMQDNGSWVGPSAALKRGGIRNHDWQELYFGDGFDVMAYRGDSRYGYAMSQGGNVGFYDRKTGDIQYAKPVSKDTIELRYNWNAPIAQDPDNDCGVYFGSQFVHYSDDCGMSWQRISPDLTTNDPEKQKQDKSGGLTIDATNAENHTTLLAIEPSTLDSDVIWVGSDDGRLHITQDKGKTWTDISSKIVGPKKGFWIPQIRASKHHAGEALVVVNDYRRNDYRPYLYLVSDYGKRVSRIMDAADAGSFVVSAIQDPVAENLLFAGTDAGLYVSFDKGGKWHHWDEGFPNVQVSDLQIQEREADLVIGTFGRSIWVMDDIRPLRAIAQDAGVLREDFACFPVGDAYNYSRRSYDGIRFVGQGEFIGENISKDVARLSFWRKPNKKDEDKEEKPKAIEISVVNNAGDTIRQYERKIGSGLSRETWWLDQDGINYPRRKAPKKDKYKPSGRGVAPGTYTIFAKLDSAHTCTQQVVVHADPRSGLSATARAAQIEGRSEVDSMIVRVDRDYDKLRKAQKSTKTVRKLLNSLPDSTKKEYVKLTDSVDAEIKRLDGLFFMPEKTKGIQSSAHLATNKIYRARGYYGGWKFPAKNAENAMMHARKASAGLSEEVDAFLEGLWADYRKQIEALKLSPFDPE